MTKRQMIMIAMTMLRLTIFAGDLSGAAAGAFRVVVKVRVGFWG